MNTWDHTTDVLVVGSGGGGMTAALTASDCESDVLLIEKSAFYGGSTALSGGALWVPNNHLMKEAGYQDSSEEALDYLRIITKGEISEERLRAYVDTIREMVLYLEKNSHVRFQIVPEYPDYYSNVKGSKSAGGRSIEPRPFNARRLKEVRKQILVPPALEIIGGKVMITAADVRVMMSSSPLARLKAAWTFVPYFVNPSRFLSRFDTRLTLGNALIGRLLLSMKERGINSWLNTAARGLIVEDERVVGLEAERSGQKLRIRANKAVILAAGGFEKNQAMREKYQHQPVSAEWSNGNPENTGDAIQMGIEIGAAVDFMDDGWWIPTTMIPGRSLPWYVKDSWWTKLALEQNAEIPWFVLIDRSLPGSIVVNAKGKRFTNEAAPYLDFVNDQRSDHKAGGGTVPAFIIADGRFRARYPFGPILPRLSTRKYIESGFLIVSHTLEGLAEKCGIDPEGLVDEVRRYNEFAAAGEDLDFNKGETPIDRYYGDVNVKPNPCLGSIDKPPFHAYRVYPGDIGTKGGLCTDEHARVLSEDGRPIDGLYATGNCSAPVMGGSYAGAGATIGPSMVFGYIAARHSSGR